MALVKKLSEKNIEKVLMDYQENLIIVFYDLKNEYFNLAINDLKEFFFEMDFRTVSFKNEKCLFVFGIVNMLKLSEFIHTLIGFDMGECEIIEYQKNADVDFIYENYCFGLSKKIILNYNMIYINKDEGVIQDYRKQDF